MNERAHHGAILAAGTLLGIGLGGFVDGILFRQILQWHSMLSSVVAPVDLVSMKSNLVWDGLFQAFTWVTTAAGVALLWWAGRRPEVPWSTSTFVGSLSLGWGLFHLVEGLIDHHLLGIHHVRPGEHQLEWDVRVLLFGGVLALAGWGLIRVGAARAGIEWGSWGLAGRTGIRMGWTTSWCCGDCNLGGWSQPRRGDREGGRNPGEATPERQPRRDAAGKSLNLLMTRCALII